MTKPSGRRQQPLVFIAPPGERHAARGHGYATDEQKNYLYTKIYVFIFMMKYLEMNIKSKILLMGRKMCYDLETNTRKIKSNIDKYIVEQQLKYLLSTKKHAFCLISKTDVTYCVISVVEIDFFLLSVY